MKKFYCAYCGRHIDRDEAYMFCDNYLQVKYFDDNKSNRYCSQECACKSLMLENVTYDDLPLDEDEREVEECRE